MHERSHSEDFSHGVGNQMGPEANEMVAEEVVLQMQRDLTNVLTQNTELETAYKAF